ncbi:hypothetical protein GQ53DRAFT_639755 [Thozetella sp. PMI_491]|nr:hypothetical protein GQ53DRAFT_639755 [Thozetella sp. PMI_491]
MDEKCGASGRKSSHGITPKRLRSSDALARCGPEIIGDWSKSARRLFRPSQLRFEVQLEIPVLFVSSPTNQKGPVPNAPIYYIKGTAESIAKTRAALPGEPKELATWLTLLWLLQRMESLSADWHRAEFASRTLMGLSPARFWDDRTLAVAVQAKLISWDALPSRVDRPYATTTLAHLIEIAAILGIYWKEFDRPNSRYFAEGNGIILGGSRVDGLGVMFSFQIVGKSSFGHHRLIPVDEIRDLCMGCFSTSFGRDENGRDEDKALLRLCLGSATDTSESFAFIGCNARTANYFRDPQAKLDHIFPVSFELLGMTCKTLHIKNSLFQMLPNPTTFRWPKTKFSPRRLFGAFTRYLRALELTPNHNSDWMGEIRRMNQDLEDLQTTSDDIRQDLHLDNPSVGPLLCYRLHDDLDQCDKAIATYWPQSTVLMVLRTHFEEVLRLLNEGGAADEGNDNGAISLGSVQETNRSRKKSFGELECVDQEDRESTYMSIYWTVVLPRTIELVIRTNSRRDSGTIRGQPEVITQIWCTLVFRMLCWLTLHTFHPNDVQIVGKVEELSRRQPVYIS